MPTEHRYAVDRLEEGTAVLIGDHGREHAVALPDLPRGVQEGDVLLVPTDDAGAPRWSAARIDAAESARRRAEARKALERLRRRDPGGDVTI